VQEPPTPEQTRPPLTVRGQAWRLAVCAAISAIVWTQAAGAEWRDHRGLFWAEVVFGLLAYVLVVHRRRAPLTIALVVAALSLVSGIAAGPATLAAVSVATMRRPWPIVAVGGANFVAAQGYTFLAPIVLEEPVWASVLINLVVNAGMMGWGMYIGSRRELIWSLRSRAERAEAEQELRLGQARGTERARIAREMHDVLAHRITQVSMQAGALAFRDDLPADELRRGLTQIQGRANEALHELRGVLGVLRDDATGELVDQPQPTYDDIAQLVADARSSGVHVTYDDLVDRVDERVPDVVGRTVYRIVQEGITNARKHAHGALLSIQVSGDPEHGIDVLLRNPLGFASTATPGAGLGLVGLAERAELRGGRLEHRLDGSTFVLHGWIPWAA
jgi:signal transduction histidine kinase